MEEFEIYVQKRGTAELGGDLSFNAYKTFWEQNLWFNSKNLNLNLWDFRLKVKI